MLKHGDLGKVQEEKLLNCCACPPLLLLRATATAATLLLLQGGLELGPHQRVPHKRRDAGGDLQGAHEGRRVAPHGGGRHAVECDEVDALHPERRGHLELKKVRDGAAGAARAGRKGGVGDTGVAGLAAAVREVEHVDVHEGERAGIHRYDCTELGSRPLPPDLQRATFAFQYTGM